MADIWKHNAQTICPWDKGHCQVWDVVLIMDIFAPSHYKDSAIQLGYVTEQAEIAKVKKYQ